MEGAVRLDTLMPVYDVSEVHQISVGATTDQVWAALRRVCLRDVPLFRMLMSARELPGRGGRPPLAHRRRRPPIARAMIDVGFLPLGGRPGVDLALGLLTRPWLPGGGGGPAVDPESFLAFDEPGWAKAVLHFTVTDIVDGARLRTETRVQTTDFTAPRRFRAYWLAVGRGSAATRRAWLAAVKRDAERAATTA